MNRQPDHPDPGEQKETHIQGEAPERHTPQGEQPSNASIEPRTLDMPPVNQTDVDADNHRRDVLRRTGTDLDAMRPVSASDDLPEHRLDQSAHDLHRETRFDPAQDNAGPQSDKS